MKTLASQEARPYFAGCGRRWIYAADLPDASNGFNIALSATGALLCMGLFSIFWLGAGLVRFRPAGFGVAAFARFARRLRHGLA